MSHIHVTDGVLPFFLWFFGFVISGIIIGFIINDLKKKDLKEIVPKAGVASAIMLIGMSIPLGIVPVHLSLGILTGFIVGPGLGFIVLFVVNLILALVGHGGITVVGLNTLVIGLEIFIGFYLFSFLINNIKNLKLSILISVFIAITISLIFMFTIVAQTEGLAENLPSYLHLSSEEQNFENLDDVLNAVDYVFFNGWTAIFIILLVGILIEAIATYLIIKFLLKIRPDILSIKI